MSKWILTLSVAFIGAILVVDNADAKRLGGGSSVGTQRSVTPPPKAPAQQAAPSQPQNTQQPGAAPKAAQPQSAGSRWGGILGGLALGGLLGYLFSGSGMGGALMLGLLAIAAVFVVRALMARRSGAPERPVQLAGFGGETAVPPAPMQASSQGALSTSNPIQMPAGFDAASFLRGARMNFMKLQVANDRGALPEIQEFTTPEMFEALKADVMQRSGKQETDIVSVDADLLELVSEDGKYWASVRFSGTERERPGDAPIGFEEVWNLVKPADGSSGWLLAGIQQMH